MPGHHDPQLACVPVAVDPLIGPDDPIRTGRQLLDRQLRAADFAALYADGRGRPSYPAPLLVKALLRFDEPGPDATPCSVFRQRLLAHDQARAACDAVLQAARDQGLLAAVDTALIDATAVTTAAAVPALAGRVQQTVRRVLLAWRKPDPLTVLQVAHDQGLAPYLAPRFTPVEDGIRTPPGRSAFGDAETVCAAVPAPADRSPALAEAVAIGERIGEERVDAGGRVTDTGATATDPEARGGAKGRNHRYAHARMRATGGKRRAPAGVGAGGGPSTHHGDASRVLLQKKAPAAPARLPSRCAGGPGLSCGEPPPQRGLTRNIPTAPWDSISPGRTGSRTPVSMRTPGESKIRSSLPELPACT